MITGKVDTDAQFAANTVGPIYKAFMESFQSIKDMQGVKAYLTICKRLFDAARSVLFSFQ